MQGGADRSAALTSGFPARRQDLFAYDAVVVANVEGDYFTRAQLTMLADFVAERGGGLLVLGGRSFAKRGLSGTPLEEVLPVELNDRRGGAGAHQHASRRDVRAQQADADRRRRNASDHAYRRVGRGNAQVVERACRRWRPARSLGGPRPGATILALTTAPGGGVFPVVAVQRYGQGRSMIFAGEASWRWKMMMPSSERAHEFFWRQAARWLATSAPDPVAITVPEAPEPGDAVSIDMDARDATFVAGSRCDDRRHADRAGPGSATAEAAPRRQHERPLHGGRASGTAGSVQDSRRGAAGRRAAWKPPTAGCTSAGRIASSRILA